MKRYSRIIGLWQVGVMASAFAVVKNIEPAPAFKSSMAVENVFFKLAEHVNKDGYMKASLTYPHYYACWFRDSSMTSISMANLAAELGEEGRSRAQIPFGIESDTPREISARILRFLWGSAAENSWRIGWAGNGEDPKSIEESRHIPARVGEDGKIFHMEVDGRVFTDRAGYDVWEGYNVLIRQHDSIPLLLLATENYIGRFGEKGVEEAVAWLKENAKTVANYVESTLHTPCANAWELDDNSFHSYDIAAIQRGLKSLAELDSMLGLGLNREKLYDAQHMAGRMLLEHFVRDGVLFKANECVDGKFMENPIREVDASAILIFNYFKPPELSKEVEMNTMARIESDLFGGNVLPLRYRHDDYFYGGRWLLLGLEAAVWYTNNGKREKATSILEYVNAKYLAAGSGMLPEQELVNPESPRNDPYEFFVRNGNSMVTDLAWSEAAYINAFIALASRKPEIAILVRE